MKQRIILMKLYTNYTIWQTLHTVAIWTFTFHKKSGFEGKFQFNLRAKSITFWAGNSNLLYPFFFSRFFWQNLSNPQLFTHCCCYSKELTYLNCEFCANFGSCTRCTRANAFPDRCWSQVISAIFLYFKKIMCKWAHYYT